MAVTFPFTAKSGGGTSIVTEFTVTAPDGDTIGSNDVVIVVAEVRRNLTLAAPDANWKLAATLSAGASDASGFNGYIWLHRGTPSSYLFDIAGGNSTGWAWCSDVARGMSTTATLTALTSWTATGTDGTIETAASSGAGTTDKIVVGLFEADSQSAGSVPTTFGTAPTGWTRRAQGFRSSPQQQGCAFGILDADDDAATSTWTFDITPQNWGAITLLLPAAGAAVNGTAAGSFGGLTGTANGTVAVTGTAAGTLGALTGTAAGVVAVTGTASGSLGALTGTAAGVRNVAGSSAGLLGALIGTAAGVRKVTGTATADLGALTGTATSGGVARTGTATGTFGGLTGTAAGIRQVAGTAAASFGALTGTAIGARQVTGVATGSLGGLTGTATPPQPIVLYRPIYVTVAGPQSANPATAAAVTVPGAVQALSRPARTVTPSAWTPA